MANERARWNEAEAVLRERFGARLAPGDGNPEGSDADSWEPCGQADGVIFLDEVRAANRALGVNDDVVAAGYERQALRYVRACGASAARYGLTSPMFSFLLARYPEINAAAKRSRHRVAAWFADDERGRGCNRAQFRDGWRVVKVEDGVWAVFYAE